MDQIVVAESLENRQSQASLQYSALLTVLKCVRLWIQTNDLSHHDVKQYV